MEDLTDQVEIIFHPDSSGISSRLTSSGIRLQPVDNEQSSTSRGAADRDRGTFKVPAVPVRFSSSSERNDSMETTVDISGEGEEMEMDVSELQHGAMEGEDDDDGEWEETLIYVDLNDIPNVQELFAWNPDDFLLSQVKRHREENPKTVKPTRPKVNLKFYNLDDDHPILQIGDRFYNGKYEEPFGTHLLFREKCDSNDDENKEAEEENSKAQRDPLTLTGSSPPPKTVLRSLIPEPDPPTHKVFTKHRYCTTDYELVAKVHKVLKMKRRNVIRRDVVPETEDSTAESRTGTATTTSTSSCSTSMIRTTVEVPDDPHLLRLVDPEDSQPISKPHSDIQQPTKFVPLRTVDLSQNFKGPGGSKIVKQNNSLRPPRQPVLEESNDDANGN